MMLFVHGFARFRTVSAQFRVNGAPASFTSLDDLMVFYLLIITQYYLTIVIFTRMLNHIYHVYLFTHLLGVIIIM